MKVVPIGKRPLLAGQLTSSAASTLDLVHFLSGATLTLLAPTLLFCVVIGHLLPFYLMACNEALGSALGFLMFKKPAAGILSCVPPTHSENFTSSTNITCQKMAA